ncbi:MAG: hypothetical protein KJ070_04250 [Verrucomicrobia bacterium]|nr:hypothetical protein [Verrucomicrobiota bacterium]
MKSAKRASHGIWSEVAKRHDDSAFSMVIRGAKAACPFLSRHAPAVSSGCVLITLFLALSGAFASAESAPLRISVYCTAGDVQQHLDTPVAREKVLRTLEPLRVSRLFLEGRRGDEYVSPAKLREILDEFLRHGIECSGGIATVPGAKFGVRQTGGLDWLNWESPKTRADVAGFFTENAPIFDEIIVDDFYCTGDVSPGSDQARGGRSWGEYRRDLLVSLIQPIIVQPTRAANRRTRLILKYPQWYDRFHLFGYDPPRMSVPFETIWVGTEVRNPQTRRMGFVQPTEGYMNFRWLSAVAGKKVRGAWFDHIECSAQNFVDQAYQSVLAGAQELTLFRLGDLVTPHPGDALLAERLPELQELASRIHGKSRRGIAYYKPPGSEGSEDMYLADYLGMIGLPILPVPEYPKDARVAFLPVQATADARLLEKMGRHLKGGATLVVTPALLKALGSESFTLAGVELTPDDVPGSASRFEMEGESAAAEVPVDLGAGLKPAGCAVPVNAAIGEQRIPFLTHHRVGLGQVFVLNVRTFSEEDFGKEGEWLLAPRPLGLSSLPQALADRIRLALLSPLGVQFQSPSGVGLVLFGKEACVCSFLDQPKRVQFGTRTVDLPAHSLVWLK